mmetsp:Transcript_126606/g.404545  ORF Transcript_126606/g.404545 Transcript_126606/m.404545 type:complete len:137 (-) Transcript_126606:63-473(-)
MIVAFPSVLVFGKLEPKRAFLAGYFADDELVRMITRKPIILGCSLARIRARVLLLESGGILTELTLCSALAMSDENMAKLVERRSGSEHLVDDVIETEPPPPPLLPPPPPTQAGELSSSGSRTAATTAESAALLPS